jgi:hypothetical protein
MRLRQGRSVQGCTRSRCPCPGGRWLYVCQKAFNGTREAETEDLPETAAARETRRVVENCMVAIGRWLGVGKIYCVVLSGMLMSEVVQGKEEEEEKGNERRELVL